VADWREIEALLLAGRGRNLALRVDRKGGKVDLTLPIPAVDPAKPDADIELGVAPGKLTLVHPGPWQQVTDSVDQIINMVGALAAKHSDVKTAHFSGPVGIMNLYYRIFQAPEGWRLAIAFSVFFNVNLALLNMLPLPVLDGGHITLAMLEAIRRKPANGRIVEIVNTACALLLFGFMLYVSFFDIGDLFGKDPAEPKAPPAASDPATLREPDK
jgi:regulator of sigma E protease